MSLGLCAKLAQRGGFVFPAVAGMFLQGSAGRFCPSSTVSSFSHCAHACRLFFSVLVVGL